MDTRYGLNYPERSSKGGIELCQITTIYKYYIVYINTINTADKSVIAVICLCSREWKGTRIFRTNTCIIGTKQISWNHLTGPVSNGFFWF